MIETKTCINCMNLQKDETNSTEAEPKWKCDKFKPPGYDVPDSFDGLGEKDAAAGNDDCVNWKKRTDEKPTAEKAQDKPAESPKEEKKEPAKPEASKGKESNQEPSRDEILDAHERLAKKTLGICTEPNNLEAQQAALRSQANGCKKPIADLRAQQNKLIAIGTDIKAFLEMEREEREAAEAAKRANARPLLDRAEEEERKANAWRKLKVEKFDLPEKDREKLLTHWKTCGEVAEWLSKDWPEKKEGCNRQDFKDRVRDAIAKISGAYESLKRELAATGKGDAVKEGLEKLAASTAVPAEETKPGAGAPIPTLNPRRYVLQTEGRENRVLFVRKGIGTPPTYTTFARTPDGKEKSFTAKALPWRDTFAEAQKDLDDYATNNGLIIESSEVIAKIPKEPKQKHITKLINGIDVLLGDERYEFARDTLEGIRKWVFENNHFTPQQYEAVVNIEESVTLRRGGEK